jgi:hypothetical protein
MMLSYSRGALAALVLGIAVWFLLVPLRLRALVTLAGAVAVAGPVIAWAFRQDGLTTDRAPIAARVDAGHEFGALLILMAAVLLVAGLAVQFAAAQRPPTPRQRKLAGRGALAVLALVPLLGLVALASAEGGISGQVSKAWDQLTDPNAETPANTPDRLTATSSVRARYWREALDIHATEPWLGSGAASATMRSSSATPTATWCRRWRTSAGSGSSSRCSPRRRGCSRRRARPAFDEGTAACPTTPSGSGC